MEKTRRGDSDSAPRLEQENVFLLLQMSYRLLNAVPWPHNITGSLFQGQSLDAMQHRPAKSSTEPLYLRHKE